jgi:signal transduction histidine kinase
MVTLDRELSILIIDDDADMRKSIVSYLEDTGCTVYQASGGRQGIESFGLHHPDLVFTDLMMPEPDGLAVVQEITRLSPATPVVIVSGNGSVSYAMDAVRKGAWDYVTKPILDFSLLDEVMERVLERAGQKKARSCGIEQLAGGIAHDFRDLLTGIAGNLHLAQANLGASHQSAAALKRAEQGGVRANELAEKLLHLSQPGALSRKLVSVPGAVEECLALSLAGRTEISARVDFAEQLPDAAMDAGELCQVLNNLILNAAQAMPLGGEISILGDTVNLGADNVHALAAGRYVSLRLSDTGEGIPPGILPKVFDPHFTTKKNGTGLGLASVQAVMVSNGGGVELVSYPGRGTSALLLIPG